MNPRKPPVNPLVPAVPIAGTDAARRVRRERRHDRSREEILQAARRVLLRDGISATTLAAVASEVGVSKTALYYYFDSKDALLFELVFGVLQTRARSVRDAVEKEADGAGALGAIVRDMVTGFAPRLDDFRLAFLHGQVAGKDAVHFDAQQFSRIRPLNDLWFAGAASRLSQERAEHPCAADIKPRLMAFLAYIAAIGLLTIKGTVASLDDPLVYSDEQLIDGFARVFRAAAAAPAATASTP